MSPAVGGRLGHFEILAPLGAGAGGHERLNFCDHRTLVVRELRTIEGQVGTGLTASPDGRTLLLTRLREMGSDLMLVEGFR